MINYTTLFLKTLIRANKWVILSVKRWGSVKTLLKERGYDRYVRTGRTDGTKE